MSPSLKEILRRDFGLELPIEGGFGSSATDPVIVTASAPEEAATTIMLVLRGVGKGLNRFWRVVARASVEADGIRLEKVTLETKQASQSEIVTETVSHYFDVSRADPRHLGLPPPPGFSHGNVRLPFEIGWLHLDAISANEPVELGHSLAYGAPGMKTTIFVYDRGLAHIPDDIGNDIVRGELLSAMSDVTRYQGDLRPTGGIRSDGTTLRQNYAGQASGSVLALGVSGGKFVKVRLTTVQDSFVWMAAEESLDVLGRLLRSR